MSSTPEEQRDARKLIQRVGEGETFHRGLASRGPFEAGVGPQDVFATGRFDFQKGGLSANETLRNRGILHATQLERLKTNEVNSVLGYLNSEVLYRVQREVQLGLVRTKGMMGRRDHEALRTEGYREMIHSVRGMLSGGMKTAGKAVRDRLVDIGVHEAQFQANTLAQVLPSSSGGFGLGIDITTPSIPNIRAILKSQPFQGRFLKDWFDAESKAAQSRIERAVNLGIATGETTDQIVRRLTGTKRNGYRDGAFETTRRGAEAITRTAITHVTARAREMTYKDNDEVVKGVQFLATLDLRTTEICAANDQQVFKVGEGPRPPLHIRCRSTTVPVLKSWKELGIDLKEAPPGTRASMNGQVPATLSYGEWLKQQPVADQNQVLGEKRAALFRRGNLPITRFVDSRWRPLSLERLQTIEQRALKHAALTAGKDPDSIFWKLPGRSVPKVEGTFDHGKPIDNQRDRATPRRGVGKTGAEVREELLSKLGDKWEDMVQKHGDESLALRKELTTLVQHRYEGTKKERDAATDKIKNLIANIKAKRIMHLLMAEHLQKEAHDILAIHGGKGQPPLSAGFSTKRMELPTGVGYNKTHSRKHRRSTDGVSESTRLNAVAAEKFMQRLVVQSQDDVGEYLLIQQRDEGSGVLKWPARASSVVEKSILRLRPSERERLVARFGAEAVADMIKTRNTVLVGSDSDVATHIHEIAHLIEGRNIHWKKQVNDFLQSRMFDSIQTSGLGSHKWQAQFPEKPWSFPSLLPSKLPPGPHTAAEALKDLRGRRTSKTVAYARHNWGDLLDPLRLPINGNQELGFRDDFMDWYMGRDYRGRGTEVTSVAFENLWRDPVRFAKRDPEMFDLIVNLARGHTDQVAAMEFRKHVPRYDYLTATTTGDPSQREALRLKDHWLTVDHPSSHWFR